MNSDEPSRNNAIEIRARNMQSSPNEVWVKKFICICNCSLYFYVQVEFWSFLHRDNFRFRSNKLNEYYGVLFDNRIPLLYYIDNKIVGEIAEECLITYLANTLEMYLIRLSIDVLISRIVLTTIFKISYRNIFNT